MEFSRPEYWIGQPFPSQGIFPTQGSNPGPPHCRQILDQLSHKWQPTSVFLPGKSHGQRSVVGYSPCGHKELDTTERLHFTSLHFMSQTQLGLPCSSVGKESACSAGDLDLIPALGRSPGEGNGNLLQHSCLGNPLDRGAWGATVYGVTKSSTWLNVHHASVHLVN